MRNRVLLLALISVQLSLCIPACAQNDKTTSDCYVIEIGAISDQNRARPAYREEFTKEIYQVPEGITIKELILSLPGIKRNIFGRLVTNKEKKTVRCIWEAVGVCPQLKR